MLLATILVGCGRSDTNTLLTGGGAGGSFGQPDVTDDFGGSGYEKPTTSNGGSTEGGSDDSNGSTSGPSGENTETGTTGNQTSTGEGLTGSESTGGSCEHESFLSNPCSECIQNQAQINNCCDLVDACIAHQETAHTQGEEGCVFEVVNLSKCEPDNRECLPSQEAENLVHDCNGVDLLEVCQVLGLCLES